MEITKRDLKKVRKFPQEISLKPIGVMYSPFDEPKGVPIQFYQSEIEGKISIFPEYSAGLKDLEGFSHIYCIYFFDLVNLPVPLQSKPFLDNVPRGIFSTRTPFRPNPIGLSILEIININNNIIHVKNVDVLNNTPILDIKPYVSEFDDIQSYKKGWLEGKVRKKLS